MAKFALILLALVAVAAAKPFGGAVVHHNKHISTSHIMSPFLGLGYGMMNHHVSHHTSIGHGLGMGYGLGMMKGIGMYPGGIGMGYGLWG